MGEMLKGMSRIYVVAEAGSGITAAYVSEVANMPIRLDIGRTCYAYFTIAHAQQTVEELSAAISQALLVESRRERASRSENYRNALLRGALHLPDEDISDADARAAWEQTVNPDYEIDDVQESGIEEQSEYRRITQ